MDGLVSFVADERGELPRSGAVGVATSPSVPVGGWKQWVVVVLH